MLRMSTNSSQNGSTPTRWCKKCGYTLNHLESNECPECGESFDPLNPTTFLTDPLSRFYVKYGKRFWITMLFFGAIRLLLRFTDSMFPIDVLSISISYNQVLNTFTFLFMGFCACFMILGVRHRGKSD